MSQQRRAAGRRRAWGRGPIILKFDSLEKREVLSTVHAPADLVGSSFVMVQNADWGDSVTAIGQVTNQGAGDATGPFNVAIYAGSRPNINRRAVPIGEVTIPDGLAAGQSIPFTTTVRLPAGPVPGMGTNGIVYIGMKVDPQNAVRESNNRNNSGIGSGYDLTTIQIAPSQPAQLITASVGTYPTTATWGKSLAVTTQISNQSYGAAPATRAQVVLTPAGHLQGTGYDVTIGSINTPAIAPWQTVNVEKSITLPEIPPVLLEGATEFTLTILPDADFVTNPVAPHVAISGVGIDQAIVNIKFPAGVETPPEHGPLPDLAMSTVSISAAELIWGKSFEVQTSVQNMGETDPGPFRVRFLLVGPSGNTTRSIFLGDAAIPGLAPGYTQTINQALTLPSRLPSGILLDSLGTGKVVAVADPENSINETFKNNNTATSAPITLRLLGSDGTAFVPNTPPPDQMLSVNIASTAKLKRAEQLAQRANATRNGQAAPTTKLFRRPPPKVHSSESFGDKISAVPKKVTDFFKDLF